MGKNKKVIVVISAPSGTGKTTIANRLIKLNKALTKSISFTTRPPRDNENDHVDYHFINSNEFKKRLNKGYFIECAKIYNNYYGTSVQNLRSITKLGNIPLLNVDYNGKKHIDKFFNKTVSIFVLPPSRSYLKKRLVKRNTDVKCEIKKRLSKINEEISKIFLYDYIVVNRDLNKTIKLINRILFCEGVF